MQEFLNAGAQIFSMIVSSYEYILGVIYYIPILGFNLGDLLIFFALIGILFALFLGGGSDD